MSFILCFENKYLKVIHPLLSAATYLTGSVSQTLPRTTGASISLVLKKGPLPPVPSVKVHATTDTYTADKTPDVLYIPPPPTTPAPVVPDGIRRSASFNYVRGLRGLYNNLSI